MNSNYEKFITDDILSKFGIVESVDLYQLAYIVSKLEEGPIVEIGTWLGKSAYTMSLYKNKNSVLHLVDPFESSFGSSNNSYPQADLLVYKENNSTTPDDVVLKYRQIIFDTKDNLPVVKDVLKDFLSTTVFHKMRSENFKLTFEPKFAFIDGGHTYQECYDDIKKFVRYDNILIAVHDYDQLDVKLACHNIANEHDRKLLFSHQMCYILDKNCQYESLIREILSTL